MPDGGPGVVQNGVHPVRHLEPVHRN
jgi:hypothetical protein